jgi:serine/threonine protein kinase
MISTKTDRYEVLELIGYGTTSRVDKARDNVIGRTVALKTFTDSFDQTLEEQFLREAQIVGQLSHHAVVQLYDVGINQLGTPFLVMEYIAGKTLEQHLENSTLTIQRACAWAADLAGALATAHRAGIVHGDVKPGNILVTADNKVKLGDFGIARLTTQLPASRRLMGTPAYLAPEQIQFESQDQRSDQFSFGIVFYQMLAGVRPFDGNSLGEVCGQIMNEEPAPPSRHNRAVPAELDRVVARCLAKDPKDRFASCEELAKSLYPFARSRPRNAAPVAKNHSWWTAPTGRRDVWVAAAACLLLALFVQLPHTIRAHFGIPAAPTRQYFRPGAPYEAFSYTRQTVRPAPFWDDSNDPNSLAQEKHPSPDLIRVEKLALVDLNKPVVAQNLSPRLSSATSSSSRSNRP